MKEFVITLLLIGLPLQPAFAADQEAKLGPERGERMAKELNLSEAQKQQVREIKGKYKDQFQALKEKLGSAREDLASSLKSPKKGADYQTRLLEKFRALQALKNEMAEKRFQMALEIREILDKDQIAKFRAMQGFEKGERHKGPRRADD